MIPLTLLAQSLTEAPVSHSASLDRLLHTVGIAPIEDIGWISITGEDRVRWLNGMVTNSIQELKPGQANYSFALNAQGQIQGDLTTFATEDALYLETSRSQVPALIAHFDRFIIMDDVELQDISSNHVGLLVAGPHAQQLLQAIALHPQSAMTKAPWRGATVEIITGHSPLIPRFELWADASTHKALQSELLTQAESLNGGPVDADALEHLRLLEGTPRYGIDILPKHLAQETAQTRALHFAKGCYLGQEIVERIRSRGNVHRTFTAFQLHGPLPPPGTPLTAEGKPIGELTSVAAIPLPASPFLLALGFIRREAMERGPEITYATGSLQGTALPISTPVRTPTNSR